MNITSKSLNINKKNNILYFTFPSFEKYKFVSHTFSSRLGGVSEGIYLSLNLSFNRGDSPQNVYKNYEIICSAIGVNPNNLVFGQLTHGNNIRKVTLEDRGKGIIHQPDYSDIDALITNEIDVPLAMTFADCVPIFFLDSINKVVAIAHSGWRGTVKKIGEKVINLMLKDYKCKLENILIGIGPSIGVCCFEVDEEVYKQFLLLKFLDNNNWFEKKDNKYYINLWKVIETMFLKMGIPKENITVTDLCTKCNNDIFFSHRATNGRRGSMAGIIGLNK